MNRSFTKHLCQCFVAMVSVINRLKEPKSGLMISDCSSFFHASGDVKGFWDSDAVGIVAEG